jgi:hypothetical protein
LSYLDPEERSEDSSGDCVDNTDIAFARIVAGLRAQGLSAQDLSAQSDVPSWPADTDDDHFNPPEPPPLPIPRARTVGGVVTLTVGVLLLAAPHLLNLGERVAIPLGLLAVTAGIGWLVIGLRPGPSADGFDDGARL